MEWAKIFYQRQNELAGVYTGEIEVHHHEKAKLITTAVNAKRVLELGAGGGQVACATALLDYDVTAIELNPTLADHAQKLAHVHQLENIHIITDDFYTVTLDGKFDVISYWDGFGIGTDADQVRLLKRCRLWLNDKGAVLIDMNTPWYWAQVAGREMTFGTAQRRYGFDAQNCRMTDTWWQVDEPQNSVIQSLRCYSPADLSLLLKEADLGLDAAISGGAVDYDKGAYLPKVPLEQAMSFMAIIHPLEK